MTDILMPALSPTMTEGTLAKWHVKPGDVVKAGDVIAEIETDKATMEVEAVDEGTVTAILVPEGTEAVQVNAVIATLAGDDEGAKPAPKAAAPAPVATPIAAAPATTPAPAQPVQMASTPTKLAPTSRIFATPLARRIAKEKGVDLAAVTGTGPHGRIVAADVKGAPVGAKPISAAPVASAKQAQSAQLPVPAESQLVPHDGMRKTIAKRLTESMQQAPHIYLTVDVELDKLMALRAEVNGAQAVKVSVNDFLIKACALALIKVPDVNVSWTDTAMVRHASADIAMAVAIPGGLITPIIFGAQHRSITDIAATAKDLADRAKARKLKPDEFQGGTFSISNLGMMGVKQFTAVINPPHAAILAVGKGEQRAVVKNGALAVATVMTVTISADHRAIDGATAAQFLEAFKNFVENPVLMLV